MLENEFRKSEMCFEESVIDEYKKIVNETKGLLHYTMV